MYLLYIDESGNEDEPTDKHFVLGGIAIFERQTFYLNRDLDGIQNKYFPGIPPIQFHASEIRARRGFWRNVDQNVRSSILADIGHVIAKAHDPGVVLFAAAVQKNDHIYGEEAVKHATEQICRRFDIFLMKRYSDAGDPQRGLLIFSEGRYDKRAKLWVRGFRELGTQWGTLKNLSDIPFFASAKDSRLLQAADFVAHAVFMLYERNNSILIRNIMNRFDQKDGVVHGLVHCPTKLIATCDCPPCSTKKSPGDLGPWI